MGAQINNILIQAVILTETIASASKDRISLNYFQVHSCISERRI